MRITGCLILTGALLGGSLDPTLAFAGQKPATSAGATSTSGGSGPTPQTTGSTTQPPVAGIAHQEELTGNWGGLRTRWKDKGVVLDSSLTQFYQGVASGGTDTGSEYNGTAQARLEFDFGKLAGWQF